MKKLIRLSSLGLLAAFATSALADNMGASIFTTNDQTPVGTVTFTDTPYGLLITPSLSHLPAGLHGFHLHQNPQCGNQGADAGGHYDPAKTNSHQGPYGNGHLGDLPVLMVTADGLAATPTLAPRLKTSDLAGLSIMIHAGPDNYSDTPAMGGGGARMACGIIAPSN